MHKSLSLVIYSAGYISSFVLTRAISSKLKNVINTFYTGWVKRSFAEFGQMSIIVKPILLSGSQHVKIGNGTVIAKGCTITCTNQEGTEISIGNNCTIGSFNHITACNTIKIGDGVLTGPYVLITDNSHGKNTEIETKRPAKRSIYSKGKVLIGNNVWIGEKATILPNVTIGDGSIIGANSVVTKDIPPYSIAAGSPARVIYVMKSNR